MMKASLNNSRRYGYELLKKAVGRYGYDLRITKVRVVDDISIRELDGLTVRDFFECYFSALNRPSFFFVQVGAHNGVSNANDLLRDFVIRLNLKGLLIEPQTRMFAELQENYKGQSGLDFANAAVGRENGRQQLYTIKNNLEFLASMNECASFNLDYLRRMLKVYLRGGAPQEVVQKFQELELNVDDCIEAEIVETYTFESLLEQHNVHGFDLLQIDTEGFDYEVIKIANVRKFKPTLIKYEHEHLSHKDQLESWRDLKALGYRLFTHGGDSYAYQVDWRSS
jgi:FkbM family methyltransferase